MAYVKFNGYARVDRKLLLCVGNFNLIMGRYTFFRREKAELFIYLTEKFEYKNRIISGSHDLMHKVS